MRAYADPTADTAIKNVMAEWKNKNRTGRTNDKGRAERLSLSRPRDIHRDETVETVKTAKTTEQGAADLECIEGRME